MAYAALLSLAQSLEQILHHHDQFLYIPPRQKLESLQEKVSFLQVFLDNYSHKRGEAVQFLEAQIRDAVYQAQDVIDSHISDRIRSDYESRGVRRGFLQVLSTTRNVERPTIQNKYEEDLLKALEQIDSVVKEVTNIQISCRVEETQISRTSALASSSSAPDGGNKIVGFDEDLIEIKTRLCGESSQLKIIPIVGMGGIGKTTLAGNIFDDSLVAYHFHIRAWITISQEYHLRDILLGLLESLPGTTKDSGKTNEELMEYVYRNLKGRTYLIVMDDMWSSEAWDDLRRIFPDDNNGSRIIITTRLADVAEYASSSPIHQMHFLKEDQSWNLLREKVFVEQSCPPELEKIGRFIARKCGGLPLAIAVVAGILVKVDRTECHWKNIAEDISLAMANNDKDFSKILTLSYDHLPNHLKPCFLYMAVFPEDYKIPVSKLVMLWVAEGLVKPVGSKSLEEVAEEYLGDLIKTNLVLIGGKKRSNGKFKFCGMHDLLRDLCIWKAQEEEFLHVYTCGRGAANQRRLAIHSYRYGEPVIVRTCASPIRSVLCFGYPRLSFSTELDLRMLQVLDIAAIECDCFPFEVTELFHLRFLAFNYRVSRHKLMLPPSVSKLHSLQTLIIRLRRSSGSFRSARMLLEMLISILPVKSPPFLKSHQSFKIWKIPQLRHLILYNAKFCIPSSARGYPVLENLQTLSGIANFKLTQKVLDMIPNLKELKVCYLDVSDAECTKLCLNNLAHLHKLETLKLDFSDFTTHFCLGRLYPPPASYALPASLKKLTLTCCKPPLEDMSIIGSLPNLEVLKLNAFHFVERRWESSEGEFQRLKFLQILGSNLVCWRAESTHFPCLQHLIIAHCLDLEEIPGAIGDVTTLQLMEIGPYNSESAAKSAVLIIEEQRSVGNDILQLRLR